MKYSKPIKIKKISLNLPESLYKDIKIQADTIGVSVTAQIITLCRQGLEQSKAVELMPLIVEQYLNEQKQTKKVKTKV